MKTILASATVDIPKNGNYVVNVVTVCKEWFNLKLLVFSSFVYDHRCFKPLVKFGRGN